MYAGGRPNRLARFINGIWTRAASAGFGPSRVSSLAVRGRRSGRPTSFPVVVAEHEGRRYLVAMLGQRSNWVANVRAAGGHAVLSRGHPEPVMLEEVEPAARAPILRAYLRMAPGARAHIAVAPNAPLSEFERIAADYPVFHVRAA
jgi:deazaflavin-dependent oxidoreductase (nitroreductase family)